MTSIAHSAGEKVVVLNGVAKTYAMTGWRVGWMIGPVDVVKAATNLQSHSTSNVNNVAQIAALTAVSGDLSAVAEMRTAFDRRRQTIVSMLAEIPGVVCPEPMGAFYAYPSVKGLLGVPLRGRSAASSAELAALILDEAEVAVVPGRGVRHARLRPDVLRARRRRPRRRRQPDRQARRRQLSRGGYFSAPACWRTDTASGNCLIDASRSAGTTMRQAFFAT